ncbi:hypothetical protein BH11MYX4_BH11MYX4_12490 [soil metagenome]
MRELVEIYEWGGLAAARFSRGSVVLDARTKSVFLLEEPAALALDVLADRGRWSSHAATAIYPRVREALPTIRRELIGESVLAPGEGITLEDASGRPLLRRIAEPMHWRRDSQDRPDPGFVELSGAMVTMADGALFIVGGQRRDLGSLARELAEPRAVAVVHDAVVLQSARSQASSPVREVWSLGASSTNNLVVARLGHASALLALLEAAKRRPTASDLTTLASTCVLIPQFRATVPGGAHALAATLRCYGARR